MTFYRKISLALIAVVIVGLSFFGGFYTSNLIAPDICSASQQFVYTGNGKKTEDVKKNNDVDFSLYWNVWDILSQDFIDKDKVDTKKMFYGSLRGLTDSLGDPYTVFMDPEETTEFNNDLSGTFEGIGAEIAIKNSFLTVVSPLDGMPAQKAGIKAGDKIMAINGSSTIGLTTDEAVKKIRGPKGTKVTLSIIREGLAKAKDFSITRDVIIVKSVTVEWRKDGLALIRISNFNDDTIDLFDSIASQVAQKKPKGIILDLRNNPGGYLDAAVEVGSQWIESGPIVLEQFADGSRHPYNSSGKGLLKNIPTVVLVNGGSASASEIVAGALLDVKKSVILGEKTFGKGSVQTMRDLPDGSSLKITIAKWLTPAGNSINEKGINPTTEVKLGLEDFNNGRDPQLNKAVELLLKKPAITPVKKK